ncbi:hypothetical protein ScPMuIL_011025 [Solemya velum]
MKGLGMFFYLVVAVTCAFLWSVEGGFTINTTCTSQYGECKTECQQKSCSCNKYLGQLIEGIFSSIEDEDYWEEYNVCKLSCDTCYDRCSDYLGYRCIADDGLPW